MDEDGCGCLIIIIVIIAIIGGSICLSVNNLSKQMGKKVVIGKDTLEAVDYSLIHGSITLSNGKAYNADYIETKILVLKDTLIIQYLDERSKNREN